MALPGTFVTNVVEIDAWQMQRRLFPNGLSRWQLHMQGNEGSYVCYVKPFADEDINKLRWKVGHFMRDRVGVTAQVKFSVHRQVMVEITPADYRQLQQQERALRNTRYRMERGGYEAWTPER